MGAYPGYRPPAERWASTTASSCAISTSCVAAAWPRAAVTSAHPIATFFRQTPAGSFPASAWPPTQREHRSGLRPRLLCCPTPNSTARPTSRSWRVRRTPTNSFSERPNWTIMHWRLPIARRCRESCGAYRSQSRRSEANRGGGNSSGGWISARIVGYRPGGVWPAVPVNHRRTPSQHQRRLRDLLA